LGDIYNNSGPTKPSTPTSSSFETGAGVEPAAEPPASTVAGDLCKAAECENQSQCAERCTAGDAMSCFLLQRKTQPDMDRAGPIRARGLALATKGCESGDSRSCYAASLLLDEEFVIKDYDCGIAAESLKYQERACDLNCADACFNLANGYLCDERDARIPMWDRRKGLRLLDRACQLKHDLACRRQAKEQQAKPTDKPDEFTSHCLECYRLGICGCMPGVKGPARPPGYPPK
jgi:hypothetical protein